ncbi:DUF3089 domain-containing protein [Pseudodesulfovibrio thermohalotolerans]|uniref:DUF3089 domain-containing protein n=1 Tax=Pseudodesulfovibrio thermohalotolerans TaxID=2880651 RepID=UPI002442207D|nr:DUF3089 domain-containing protein [Pseudodesulfovibrio thermohalotolerans]WFS62987.1 DUF3089 domain-containing protein [Pseudodesulfovibrio thermohalotolerans]
MRFIRIVIFSLFFCVGAFCVASFAADSDADDCIPPCPDYAQPASWAALPERPNKNVDVFYVYPTIYFEKSPKNMDVFDEKLRSAAQGLLNAQAGAYSSSANLFAPYYRQVTFACLDPEQDMTQNRYFRIGADDVHRAFDYYLNHLNDGRPFILAAHSQGSVVLLDLLFSRFKNPALRKKLVAAYVIGYSVTREDLARHTWIKPAQGADDIGVVVSWNTQAPGATGSPVLLPGALCINPLNWRTDDTPADRSLNLGAVFFDDAKGEVLRIVPQYTGARIDLATGALVASPPDTFVTGHFPPGVLHKYDYAFWYRNIQRNVNERIDAWFKHYGCD